MVMTFVEAVEHLKKAKLFVNMTHCFSHLSVSFAVYLLIDLSV